MRRFAQIALLACLPLLAGAAFAFDNGQYENVPADIRAWFKGVIAPNGVPWANGYVDYLKLVNARGGINGVKIIFEECETGYATDRGVECYERLKGKGPTGAAATISVGTIV